MGPSLEYTSKGSAAMAATLQCFARALLIDDASIRWYQRS